MNLGETYSLYKDDHAPPQHPCTDKRTHLRTRRPVHTSRPVTAESVHAAHIDYGHDARLVHDNNACTHPAGPHQFPAAPPPPQTCHIRQALRSLLRLIRSIPPILGAVLSFLVRGIPVTNASPRTLTRVSDARGRVLCSECHGENNDEFLFCESCAAPTTYGSRDSDNDLLCIDEHAIEQRFAQFTKAVAGKPSTCRRDSDSLLLGRFL